MEKEWGKRVRLSGIYKSKECPNYEKWYDCGFNSELLFRARAKCIEFNERTYRRPESGRKACMCDSGGMILWSIRVSSYLDRFSHIQNLQTLGGE